MNRDLFTTGLLLLIAVSVGVGVWSLSQTPPVVTESGKPDPVGERVGQIVGFNIVGEGETAEVQYTYKGDKLPPKITPLEVVRMRTEKSFTEYLGDKNDQTLKEYLLRTAVFTTQEYVQEGADWHYAKRDVTTKKNFDSVMKGRRPLSWLWGNIAYAVDYGVNTGYGQITCNFIGTATWADCHDVVSGAYPVLNSLQVVVTFTPAAGKFGDNYSITRAFLPFDTSSIPSSATISAASLTLYPTATFDQDNDGTDYITVIVGNQASCTTLDGDDFDNVSTTEGNDTGQRKDITSISVNTAFTITLNATGRGWIKKSGESADCGGGSTGITSLGLREGHDNTNTAVGSGTNSVTIDSNSSNTYLTVTYTTPSSFAPWMFWEF